MEKPENKIYTLFRKMLENRVAFALFRMPFTQEPCLVLEDREGVEVLDSLEGLGGRRGFLLAPFRISGKHPVLLLPFRKVQTGWQEIREAIETADQERNPVTLPAEDNGQEFEFRTPESRKQDYIRVFQHFMEELSAGRFSKLVLSRSECFPLDGAFSLLDTFVEACNRYPQMMVSLCCTPYSGIWMGSSPEVLLAGGGKQWHTVALAGTMALKGSDGTPLVWSAKNRREQAYVRDFVFQVLEHYALDIEEKGPFTVQAGSLAHLKTSFSFRLKEGVKAGELLEALHPTPAVCGLPKSGSYAFIAEEEGYDRMYYSGIVGIIDPEADTSLYVNIRCMHILPGKVSLFAGGGILKSSELEAEWKETRHKMDTMKACIKVKNSDFF